MKRTGHEQRPGGDRSTVINNAVWQSYSIPSEESFSPRRQTVSRTPRLTSWPTARRPLIMHPLFWFILCFGLVTAGRPTRSLSFRKGSSFFYRVNYKVTSLSYTPIFAYAAGFKVVWELPSLETSKRRTGRSVDDVYQAAELVYNSHGFNGRSCLLKNICQAMEYVSQRDGVIAKILQLLIGSYTASSLDSSLDCDVHIKNCPLQLIDVDPFITP